MLDRIFNLSGLECTALVVFVVLFGIGIMHVLGRGGGGQR